MNDLLDIAIAGHGGREIWEKINKIKVTALVGGSVWPVKGWPGALANMTLTADAKTPRSEISSFLEPNQTGVFEPNRTTILSPTGEVIDVRIDPRKSFDGHTLMTPWDAQNVLYFAGYAMWTYLTVPFLFLHPGFSVEEIEPWTDEGETQRRLRVTFPEDIPSHCKVQTFYFDASGILRRHDYSVDVMGGTTSGHFTLEPKTYQGIVFPTKRQVYAIGPDNRPVPGRGAAITIDIQNVEIE